MYLTLGRRVSKTRKAFEKQLIQQGMSKEDAKRLSVCFEDLKDNITGMLKQGIRFGANWIAGLNFKIIAFTFNLEPWEKKDPPEKLSYGVQVLCMAGPTGIEPATYGLRVRRSKPYWATGPLKFLKEARQGFIYAHRFIPIYSHYL